jgi:rare lipoprotein A
MRFLYSIISVILILVLLAGCESTTVYTRNPNVTPRRTPGQKQDSKRKQDYMVASWYGNAYHGKQTASGEIYNMYDYTAAHRTLPFGTRLKLINELNNKEAIVIINDRGPFIQGRDIDVSFKTAQTLDFVNLGVCKLRVIYLD